MIRDSVMTSFHSSNIAIATDKQVAGWWRVTGATAGL